MSDLTTTPYPLPTPASRVRNLLQMLSTFLDGEDPQDDIVLFPQRWLLHIREQLTATLEALPEEVPDEPV